MPLESSAIAQLIGDEESQILPEWLDLQRKSGALEIGRINEAELAAQCRDFLRLFREALATGGTDVANSAFNPVRDFLGDVSRSRALQGFSPTETATFVFSLKQPLFNVLNREKGLPPAALAKVTWATTTLLDELGLLTFEAFQKSREEVILRQQREQLSIIAAIRQRAISA